MSESKPIKLRQTWRGDFMERLSEWLWVVSPCSPTRIEARRDATLTISTTAVLVCTGTCEAI